MNNILQNVNSLRQALASNDQNSSEKRLLLEAFCTQCALCSQRITECLQMLEQQRIVEALTYMEKDEPSLHCVIAVLSLPYHEEILMLTKELDMATPPAIDSSIIQRIKDGIVQIQDESVLLNAYRKIVYQESNYAIKLIILRQLSAIQPQELKWRETIQAMEKKYQGELTERAKKAICNSNYAELTYLEEELSQKDWLLAPPDFVMQKIAGVMDQQRQIDLQRYARLLLNAINDAYSALDYIDLENGLGKWDAFISKESYRPTNDETVQLNDARQYFDEQRRIRQDEEKVHSCISQLRSGIENGISVTELERLHGTVQAMNRSLPPELENQYQAYCETAELEDNRQRRIRLCLTALAVLVIVILTALIVPVIRRKQIVSSWEPRLKEALDSQPLSACNELFTQLKKEHPEVLSHPTIVALSGRLRAKSEEIANRKGAFKTLMDTLNSEISDYDNKKAAIDKHFALAKKYISDEADNSAYQILDQQRLTLHKEYVGRQNKRFLEKLRTLNRSHAEIAQAMNRGDFAVCDQQLPTLVSGYRELRSLNDVPPDTLKDHQTELEAIEALPQQLAQEKEVYKQIQPLLQEIWRHPIDNQLPAIVNSFITEFPNRRETFYLRGLLDNLNQLPKLLPDDPTHAEGETVFHDDAKRLKFIDDGYKNLQMHASDFFIEINRGFEENPLYALILQDANGTFYDFYFSKELLNTARDSSSNDNAKITGEALLSENGNRRRLRIEFSRSENTYPTVKMDNRIYTGRMLHPAPPLQGKNTICSVLAPHQQFFSQMAGKLANADGYATEKIVVENLKWLLGNNTINPYLRAIYARKMSEWLVMDIGAKDGPELIAKRLDASLHALPRNFNWMSSFVDDAVSSQQKLQQALKDLRHASLTLQEDKLFQRTLLTTALERKITPVGYLRRATDGVSWELSGGHTPASSFELWVYSPTAPHWKIIGKKDGDRMQIAPKEATKLTPMQLVFTPKDGRDTKELRKKMEELAKQKDIKHFVWPNCWPGDATILNP